MWHGDLIVVSTDRAGSLFRDPPSTARLSAPVMRTRSRVSSVAPAPVLELKTSTSLSSGMPDPHPPSRSFFHTFQSNPGKELRMHIPGAPTLLLGDAETAFNMAQVNGYFKEQSPQEGPQRAGRVASMTRAGISILGFDAETMLIERLSCITGTFALTRNLNLVFRYRTREYRQIGTSH